MDELKHHLLGTAPAGKKTMHDSGAAANSQANQTAKRMKLNAKPNALDLRRTGNRILLGSRLFVGGRTIFGIA